MVGSQPPRVPAFGSLTGLPAAEPATTGRGPVAHASAPPPPSYAPSRPAAHASAPPPPRVTPLAAGAGSTLAGAAGSTLAGATGRTLLGPLEPRPAPGNVRQVLAVGGGRGGAGKSVLAVNLAVYLAQLGRSVVLVDADPSGAELHTMFGMPTPVPAPGNDDEPPDELATLPTSVPGLALMPQLYARGSTSPLRPGRKIEWARRLRHLGVDYVLLDLGAGTGPSQLDLFLGADFGLTVTQPDPPSVEATYRFVRALFQRRMRRALVRDRFKMRLMERAQAELPPLPSPLELVRALARFEPSLGELAAQELATLRPRLVVNGTRLRADSELGAAMGDLARRYLGVELDDIGHVEQDDAIWLSVVRQRPLLIDSPTSKSARHLERIARRVLALATSREPRVARPVSLVPTEPTLHEVLGTHRGATDEEIRRSSKRQRELYQSGSLALTSLLDEAALRAAMARIDEAHDTLLDPVRRRAYELSTYVDDPEPEAGREGLRDAALEAERAMLREELARQLDAETEFDGRLLAKVREAQGVELEEIARATKIAAAHLRAIEAEDFGALPATVYVRGFLQQLARHLRLDPAQVTRTYLRRLRAHQASTGVEGA